MKNSVICLTGILIIMAASCNRGNGKHAATIRYFETSASRAEKFSLEKKDNYTVLTVNDPWQGAREVSHVWYLVKRGHEPPYLPDNATLLYVPVRKLICMSTTHIAMVAALGEEESISGVSGAGFIYNDNLREKVKAGDIADVGYEAGMNTELIIRIAPELIIMYGVGSESAGYLGKIRELGIPVMFNADYLEADPLGKAEWIKVFGALFCREELADSIYNNVLGTYEDIKAYINEAGMERPSVMLGLPFRDTWFVSPGNSFTGMLISDAGGRYLWNDTRSSVSMPFSLEKVYLESLKADFWLNTGNAVSKAEIASYDKRFEELLCFRQGNLYNNNKRISPVGGNDYWESGTLNPHLILKDIAAILHPSLFPEHILYYYRKIE